MLYKPPTNLVERYNLILKTFKTLSNYYQIRKEALWVISLFSARLSSSFSEHCRALKKELATNEVEQVFLHNLSRKWLNSVLISAEPLSPFTHGHNAFAFYVSKILPITLFSSPILDIISDEAIQSECKKRLSQITFEKTIELFKRWWKIPDNHVQQQVFAFVNAYDFLNLRPILLRHGLSRNVETIQDSDILERAINEMVMKMTKLFHVFRDEKVLKQCASFNVDFQTLTDESLITVHELKL